MKRPKWLLWLVELRAPFFTGSVAPVLVGTALAYHRTWMVDWPLFLWALLGTVCIHAGANVLNDYFDHRSGNDAANTEFVRPFTGGSRMIQQGLLSPREVLTLGLVCLAGGAGIGLYLFHRVGLFVLVLGAIGILGGCGYSAPPLSLAARGLGETVVGVNFGMLPVVGAYYVQTQEFSWDTLLVALPLAVLIAAVLFVNQFQDFEADQAVGKRNWVVRLGRPRAVPVFALLAASWPVPIVLAVLTGVIPWLCLLAIAPLFLSIQASVITARNWNKPQEMAPANAKTILTHLTVGILLAVTLVLAR